MKKQTLINKFLAGTYMEKANVLECDIKETKYNEISKGRMKVELNGNIIDFDIKSDEKIKGYRDRTILRDGGEKMEIDGYNIRSMVSKIEKR